MRIIYNIKEIIKENKTKTILILFLLLFAIIMIIINNHNDENKINKNNNYVYTSETNIIGDIKSRLPYINLYGDVVKDINKLNTTMYYTENILEEKYMDYEYYVNDDILSLIVKIYYLESNDYLPESTYFYNIYIPTGELLTNNQLLEKFNIDDAYVEEKLLKYVEEYYNYEIKNNYISNCDFDCYKEKFNNNILENIDYYIKDKSLYAYQTFLIDKDFAYDENKPFDLFRFKIS